MNKKTFFMALLAVVFLSCKSEIKKDEGHTSMSDMADSKSLDITVSEAKSMIAGNPEIVLLDVRTPEEIALGKIDGALELDFNDPKFSEKVETFDKGKEYIVYCAAGGRSAKAVELMQQKGFSNLHNLTEGYTGWSQQ
jgi:rhodanese-related sulfurtransferase